jgi:hypothetical protein
MGRQTRFHMLREDTVAFLDFVREHDPVVVTLRDAQSAEVESVSDPAAEMESMTLWNTALLPQLQRQLVTRPGGHDYYRVPYSLPTLELSPSTAAKWNGKPALLQGRVYGFAFDTNTVEYERWYNAVARWIRTKFVRSQLTHPAGYLGPAALEWFRSGGILLPVFTPPRTPEWLSVVEAQESARSKIPLNKNRKGRESK